MGIRQVIIYILEFVSAIALAIILGLAAAALWPLMAVLPIDLVGSPGSIDLGAVLVGLVYFVPVAFLSIYLYRHTKYKMFSLTFALTGGLMAFLVFVLVSSMIWL